MSINGLILQSKSGSELYGTSLPGQSDNDEMGICLEPSSSVTGLDKPFEQFEKHSSWERPGGKANRSSSGDSDLVVYSAKKWARLTTSGNPTTMLLLFADQPSITFISPVGEELLANADKFVSKQVAPRFIGYLESQYQGLVGKKKPRVNRPGLVEAHSFDTKYAMHAVRLGIQGVELLSTGKIILPIPEPHRSFLLAIRRGEVPFKKIIEDIEFHAKSLKDLKDQSKLPEKPYYAWVNSWLHESHLNYWNSQPSAGSDPSRS